jgi:hypothetical protein
MRSTGITRSAGIGLAVYGVGTAVPFMGSGTPGGDYLPSDVADYVAPGHHAVAFALWLVGALAALGLVVVAAGVRRMPQGGALVAGLALVGAALGVTGAFVSGGVDVAMSEGGVPVRDGVAAPVVYLITEIGNLLAVCGPALAVGVAALVLAARAPLHRWLRVFSVVAGICGILAPAFYTYFVFLVWTVVTGIVLARSPRTSVETSEPLPSLV